MTGPTRSQFRNTPLYSKNPATAKQRARADAQVPTRRPSTAAKIESVREQLFKHPVIAAFNQTIPGGFAHADGSKLLFDRDPQVTPNNFTHFALLWQRTTPYPPLSKTVAGNAIAAFRSKQLGDGFIERRPGEFVNEHGVTMAFVEPPQLWTKFYRSSSKSRTSEAIAEKAKKLREAFASYGVELPAPKTKR